MELKTLNIKLKEASKEELEEEEEQAPEKIKSDSGYFFEHLSSFRNGKRLGSVQNANGKLTNNAFEIANILNKHFCSVRQTPSEIK